MNRDLFGKALAKQLYPLLRKDGFRGSGATLRRIEGPVIHVFNVQGSTSADRCYLNLGAHLAFLTTVGGGDVAPEKIQESHCIFRDRIDSPRPLPEGWMYGESEEEMERNVERVIDAWHAQGVPFFARYRRFPDDFILLVNDPGAEDLHPFYALHLARVATHLGLKDRAKTIARSALDRTGPRTVWLYRELSAILA